MLLVGGWLSFGPGFPTTNSTAQNLPRARRTIRTLTAPSFQGRGYVRDGAPKAARYLRQRFHQLGLRPLGQSFSQPFTVTINTFPGQASVAVDATSLAPGQAFIADAASGFGHLRGPVYAFDTLAFTNEEVRTRLLSTDLRTRVLVLRQSAVSRLATLPPAVQQHLTTAAARVTLVQKLTATLADHQLKQPRVEVLASAWPKAAQSVTLALDARLAAEFATENVVGYLPGRIQPDSFLLVTAHYDHLGTLGRRTYFPGANDNASGVAMLLELAAHYARPENRPAYSLVFVAFGAEEAGLIGSRYFVEHPPVALARIRFLLNLDLLGTGSEGATVVNGRVFEAQYRQLQALNEAGHYLPALAARGRAANSDHYYFSERGVPAFFLYTRGGPTAYHDVYDRPETLPLTAFASLFRLLCDFLTAQGATPR